MKPTELISERDALRLLRQRGFSAEFEVRAHGLRVIGSDRQYPPERVTIVEHYRFEGASDPEDMSVIYAVETDDGLRGVVMDAYGAYANPELAEFLEHTKHHEHA